MTSLEIAANGINTVSILLAGRNSLHTWWTGLVGSILFGVLFYQSQLYADATLQLFFLGTGVWGWWNWRRGSDGAPLRVRSTSFGIFAGLVLIGACVTAGYGWLLHRFTNAYAPFWDSAVLAFSVIAQGLLMARRVENWWFWLVVNTISVPLFFSRSLHITAVLYIVYWVNAVISLRHWRKLMPRA